MSWYITHWHHVHRRLSTIQYERLLKCCYDWPFLKSTIITWRGYQQRCNWCSTWLRTYAIYRERVTGTCSSYPNILNCSSRQAKPQPGSGQRISQDLSHSVLIGLIKDLILRPFKLPTNWCSNTCVLVNCRCDVSSTKFVEKWPVGGKSAPAVATFPRGCKIHAKCNYYQHWPTCHLPFHSPVKRNETHNKILLINN
jgi:hypothetical protein